MKGGVRLWDFQSHNNTCMKGHEGWWETLCMCWCCRKTQCNGKGIVLAAWMLHRRVDANRGVMAAWMCRCCCKTHCNGCMNVAWDLCWGGSRSTKPCVFPCKVAAGGDETYLVCAAGAAALVSSLNRFHLCVLQRVYAADAHKARTHEPGWGMAHASSIDEKGRIVYPWGNFRPASCGHYWYIVYNKL